MTPKKTKIINCSHILYTYDGFLSKRPSIRLVFFCCSTCLSSCSLVQRLQIAHSQSWRTPSNSASHGYTSNTQTYTTKWMHGINAPAPQKNLCRDGQSRLAASTASGHRSEFVSCWDSNSSVARRCRNHKIQLSFAVLGLVNERSTTIDSFLSNTCQQYSFTRAGVYGVFQVHATQKFKFAATARPSRWHCYHHDVDERVHPTHASIQRTGFRTP